MHFSTEAVPAEIQAQMTRLIAITGKKPWDRRLEWLHEQVRAHRTMPFYLVERFGVEIAYERIREHYKHTGRYPWPPQTADEQRFYSLVAMLTRCHARLSQGGKKRLKGMIEDALKNDLGFASLAFEMKIAAHLMTKGFDVTFQDIEQGGGFDYLVEKDGVEMEVECKLISGDIGRKIHTRRFHHLGTSLLPVMSDLLETNMGGYLIRVAIPGRLGGESEEHRRIQELIKKAISFRGQDVEEHGYKISVSDFSIPESPFGTIEPDQISLDHVQKFLKDRFGIDNQNALVQFNARNGAALVVMESDRQDTVLMGIYRVLKESAQKQFSGERPALLCCELADMTEGQLRSFGEAQGPLGLDYMVSDLLVKRSQIHTVAFTTPGTVRIQQDRHGDSMRTSTRETGLVYRFKNPDHPQATDSRYDIFY